MQVQILSVLVQVQASFCPFPLGLTACCSSPVEQVGRAPGWKSWPTREIPWPTGPKRNDNRLSIGRVASPPGSQAVG